MSARRRQPITFTLGPLKAGRRTLVQAVTFPRQHWKRAEAVAWLKRHGFKAAPLETLRGSYRATQYAAGRFSRLRTVHTSGHPQPLTNPLSKSTIEALTRDPREQGFMDAKAGKVSAPPPWYTAAERGLYLEGYIAGGQGRKGRATPPARAPKPTRRNPRVGRLVVPEKAFRQAITLYRKFREAEPRKITTARLEVPRILMAIGRLPFIHYLTTHKGGAEILYKHTFAPHAQPMLAASHDGRALYLVGGQYDFTQDGIVDRPK